MAVALFVVVVRVATMRGWLVGLVVVILVVLLRVNAKVALAVEGILAQVVDGVLYGLLSASSFKRGFCTLSQQQQQHTAVCICNESPGLYLPAWGPMGISRFCRLP